MHFLEELKITVNNAPPLGPEEVANSIVHQVTKETITKYKKLIADPLLQETWSNTMCKELGRLCQGFEDTKGADTMQFLDLDGINTIPQDRIVTYARIVVDYRPHKKDPNRVRIIAGGNLIQYSGELTTRTADMRTSKNVEQHHQHKGCEIHSGRCRQILPGYTNGETRVLKNRS